MGRMDIERIEMSGIDEQKPICPVCGKMPTYFRFQFEWEWRNCSIWLLGEKFMYKYGHSSLVVFDWKLRPISKRNEFIDMITFVRCNDCNTKFNDGVIVRKLVTILKRIYKQEEGK